jgi:HEPN domain-containing protein
METARQLLAQAERELDTAIALAANRFTPDAELLRLARSAAQLSLRTVLRDRGIAANPDADSEDLAALLSEAGVDPPETVARLAGIGESVEGGAEALGAASAAVMWAAASLTPA